MKVKELLEKLREFDPEADVYFYTDYNGQIYRADSFGKSPKENDEAADPVYVYLV